MLLRPYQSSLKASIAVHHAFGSRNVLAVMPTGAGKTVVMSAIAKDHDGRPQVAIAHRQELVMQISLALARAGVYHRIVAPDAVVRFVVEQHVEELGRSYWHAAAPAAVAGVDTLNARSERLERFLRSCVLWQTDEAHHVQKANKWGAPLLLMPDALGVGWTATPRRPAGQSLSRDGTGLFDALAVGPTPRELIDAGFLCEFKIIGPRSALSGQGLGVSSSTGDYNRTQLAAAAHRAQITGDVVEHYLKFARGKRGVTFAVDVGLATEYAEAFRQRGVPAEVLHAKTGDRDRVNIMRRFRAGELLQVVNVDVLGEGFDCPAIEVCQFARPTKSYGLYVQQFGRALRIMDGKTHGLIIDHVGNVSEHGLPDGPQEWTLEAIPKRTSREDPPVRTCTNPSCFAVFEGFSRTCPECGHCPPRAPASRPEQVDGNLAEYSSELLEHLRKEAARIVSTRRGVPFHLGRGIAEKVRRAQAQQREAQRSLREALVGWGGVRRDLHGEGTDVAQMRFFHTFGVDVATAQTLGTKEAAALEERIWLDIHRRG